MLRLARLRVPLGFACAGLALLLARPIAGTWWAGLGVASIGELLRVWAAGHIEKGREITRSGPYRFMRHPLYAGSSLIAAGFVIASWSLPVALIAAVYLWITLRAAIHTEEARLDAQFDGAYSAYRAGLAAPSIRRFSLSRMFVNREYRAVIGLTLAFAFLAWRISH
jgi:protein-S-isoprenylcysteine O-methyltransferase Ste14